MLDKAGVSAREIRRRLVLDRRTAVCLVIVSIVSHEVWGAGTVNAPVLGGKERHEKRKHVGVVKKQCGLRGCSSGMGHLEVGLQTFVVMDCGGPDEAEQDGDDGGGIRNCRKAEKTSVAEEELEGDDNNSAEYCKY